MPSVVSVLMFDALIIRQTFQSVVSLTIDDLFKQNKKINSRNLLTFWRPYFTSDLTIVWRALRQSNKPKTKLILSKEIRKHRSRRLVSAFPRKEDG